jgi:hypothetical protein
MAAIGKRVTELQTITNKLLGPGPRSATLDELRNFAISRLAKIRELISHPESVDLARAELAEHFGTFTLEPTVGRRTGSFRRRPQHISAKCLRKLVLAEE